MVKKGAKTHCFRISSKTPKNAGNSLSTFVPKFGFLTQNETCLVDFLILEQSITSRQLFLPSYLSRKRNTVSPNLSFGLSAWDSNKQARSQVFFYGEMRSNKEAERQSL